MSVRSIPFWTEADEAELAVLLHALVFGYAEHRQRCEACNAVPCPELGAWYAHKAGCRACQGDAPLSFGVPCWDWRDRRLEHGRTYKRCNPCPHLQTTIREVVDWHGARQLLSHAEALRAAENEAGS